MSDFFDYPRLLRESLRHVPRQALERVAAAGMPVPHHFYLTFRTDHPRVGVSQVLRQSYPEEMTVVLKTQYRDLEVDADGFSVTLFFGGRPERIHVPFTALTAFVDPAAEFGLRFDGGPEGEDEDDESAAAPETPPARSGRGASVVSFDDFRKKSKR